MKNKFQLIKQDCIKWMEQQKPKYIDCIITSPPYNLNIKYGNYEIFRRESPASPKNLGSSS